MDWWEGRTCGNGHPLGRVGATATVSLSYITCPGCPANTDDRGHHVAYCRTDGCMKPAYPDGHEGAVPPQR